MKHEQMVSLIKSAGLEINLAFEHQLRYSFGIWVGNRSQCDVIAFKSREEFERLSVEDAQKMINDSKADMIRAAHTKSGLLKSEIKPKKTKSKMEGDNMRNGDSDAEKYLRQMMARGSKLAKTVVYR